MSGSPLRRIRYDDAFKVEAVRRWKSSHRSAHEIAKELGISSATLYLWGRESKPRGADVGAARFLRELQEEIGRLRQDNARLRQQCETLKKTFSILVESPKSEAQQAPRLHARSAVPSVEHK